MKEVLSVCSGKPRGHNSVPKGLAGDERVAGLPLCMFTAGVKVS